MSIQQTSESPPQEYITDSLRPRIPNRDSTAIWRMRTLSDVMYSSPDLKYARGTWGYTILRTVYTEESDLLFPIVVKKLQKWVTEVWVHWRRFPRWGEKGEEGKKSNGSVNDEVARRFCVEVIEDKENLNIPELKDASPEDIKLLCDRFSSWAIGVGGDPEHRGYATTPRMLLFLAIDSSSLHNLVKLLDETPPQRTARDLQEKLHWRNSGDGWLWLFDYQSIRDYDPSTHPPGYRGWMKLEVADVEQAMFYKAGRLDKDDKTVECKLTEETDGSMSFWCHGM
ncbi:hypothetical protein EDB80DRAFT_730179 [Ilyonectria destructans]|nr:hypothetical protein EDB80DRAFT_730179 [Ilyonectria destructans]